MATWRELLELCMREQGDLGPVVAFAPDRSAFDLDFTNPHSEEITKVLAWTEHRVYFPVFYQGDRWIESVPRNPVPEGQEPVGSTFVPEEALDSERHDPS